MQYAGISKHSARPLLYLSIGSTPSLVVHQTSQMLQRDAARDRLTDVGRSLVFFPRHTRIKSTVRRRSITIAPSRKACALLDWQMS